MKKSLKIVLDTSIFVNPDARYFFGKTPEDALTDFLNKLKRKEGINCYIPPSVYEELMKFMGEAASFSNQTLINKKPPSSYETTIPALFVYEFIEDVRARINKGLRVAEKHARKAQKESEDSVIKSLREEYRVALREGIVDSKEDFDLILLAKELNARLATSDNGLVKWAQKLGIPTLDAKELKELLENQD